MKRVLASIVVALGWLAGGAARADLLREAEPNDAVATAQPVIPTSCVGGTIGAPSDRDVFAFRLPAGATVQASLLARGFRATADPGSSLTGVISVLDTDGSTVLVQDQSAGGFDDPAVSVQVFTAGTYYVSVTDASGLGGPDYRYVLSIEREGNDTFDTARPIEPPVVPSIDSLIWPAADLDFYAFQGTAGQTATIDIDSAVFDPLVPPVKGVVTLYRPDRTLLASDAYSTGDPNDPFIQTVLPVSGTYFIEVHDLRGFIGSPASFYQLSVRVGPAAQNNTPATAIPIPLPRGLSGTVCPAGVPSDFALSLPGAGTVGEDVDAREDLQSLLHAAISLLAPNGTPIASSSASPDPALVAGVGAGAYTAVVQGPSDGLCEDAYYRLWIDDDRDGDGLRLPGDLCPLVNDPGQTDLDRDGVGDACDVCMAVFNPEQERNLRTQDEVGNTLILTAGSGLQWISAPGSIASNVYRFLEPGPGVRPVFDCLADNVTAASSVDTNAPPPGAAFFYVVTGENCGESGGGRDSSGQERTLHLCPKSI
ncbi:MAG TPA: PPC domain-containing protein [Candidatus Polarisedimenticolia bacterium]|nr:PPC domain-containing protein [Candidatus Polarisedimenticolia bacterium]